MTAHDFTDAGEVLAILKGLHRDGIDRKIFSDVVDCAPGTDAASPTDEIRYQYVDLVQEGGGVLGIGLLGYIYVLAQLGIRFLQLAGTSAGSITTLLLAAAGPLTEARSPWVLDKLASKNLYDFVDGDSDARDFIDALLSGAGWPKLMLRGAQVLDNFRDDHGLNPGTNFHNWLKGLLAQRGIRTLADLTHLRQTPPAGGLFRRRPGTAQADRSRPVPADEYARIALIASDITTESKIELPRMADMFWSQPEQLNPADFVRASMAIPLFFTPVRIKGLPQGRQAWEKWNDRLQYNGSIPDEVVLVDGGVLSNFPIDVFHNFYTVPSAPTFGVKLGVSRADWNRNDKVSSLVYNMFNAARHIHDVEFIIKNPDYQHLLCVIDTGPHNWLDFGLKDDAKLDLFIRGAQAAESFLRRFDWEQYKQLRKRLAQVHHASEALSTDEDGASDNT